MYLKELDANLIVVLDALLIDASVTRAAERLGRSPSAVSHALSNLREVFDDDLFVRAGQRLVPTARAQDLAATVHVIVAGLEGLLRPETPFDPSTQTRHYALACPDTIELTLFRELRARLAREAPGITVAWRPLHARACVEDLRSGALHFAVLPGMLSEDAPDVSFAAIATERYVTVCGAARRGAAPPEFAEASHIMADGASDPVRQHFAAHGLTPGETVEVSSALVGLHLALTTGALITVPAMLHEVVARDMALQVVKLPGPPLEVPITLYWHRSHERDECHHWVRRQLREVAESLVSPPAASKAR